MTAGDGARFDVCHAARVVQGHQDLELPLVGSDPPEPDVVLLELTSYVGYDLPHAHILPLTCPEV